MYVEIISRPLLCNYLYVCGDSHHISICLA